MNEFSGSVAERMLRLLLKVTLFFKLEVGRKFCSETLILKSTLSYLRISKCNKRKELPLLLARRWRQYDSFWRQ
jgi:hypothetical protein